MSDFEYDLKRLFSILDVDWDVNRIGMCSGFDRPEQCTAFKPYNTYAIYCQIYRKLNDRDDDDSGYGFTVHLHTSGDQIILYDSECPYRCLEHAVDLMRINVAFYDQAYKENK